LRAGRCPDEEGNETQGPLLLLHRSVLADALMKKGIKRLLWIAEVMLEVVADALIGAARRE
jgi:hypothetical protein